MAEVSGDVSGTAVANGPKSGGGQGEDSGGVGGVVECEKSVP